MDVALSLLLFVSILFFGIKFVLNLKQEAQLLDELDSKFKYINYELDYILPAKNWCTTTVALKPKFKRDFTKRFYPKRVKF